MHKLIIEPKYMYRGILKSSISISDKCQPLFVIHPFIESLVS